MIETDWHMVPATPCPNRYRSGRMDSLGSAAVNETGWGKVWVRKKPTTTKLPQQSIQFNSCAHTSVFFLAASVCCSAVLVPAANSISVSSLKTTQALPAPIAFSKSENNYLSHHRRESEADGETGGKKRTPKQGAHAITAAAGSHLAEDTG